MLHRQYQNYYNEMAIIVGNDRDVNHLIFEYNGGLLC